MGSWELMIDVLVAGVLATALMDAWSALLRRIGVATLDYALVGRWLGHMLHGQWRHAAIARAAPVRNERLTGWVAHYLLGIGYVAGLVALTGPEWLLHPSLAAALAFGLLSMVVPWCVLQPALGAGFFASRTPRPWHARVQTVATHSVFGMGMYLGACCWQSLSAWAG